MNELLHFRNAALWHLALLRILFDRVVDQLKLTIGFAVGLPQILHDQEYLWCRFGIADAGNNRMWEDSTEIDKPLNEEGEFIEEDQYGAGLQMAFDLQCVAIGSK